MQTASVALPPLPKIRVTSAVGFVIVHLAALGVFWVGFSWKGVLLCILSYYLRMFAITAGYHRYFSHRTYKLGRVSQFLMAFLGGTAAQKGPLWWASNHRHHHKYSDQPQDLHSPVQRGFFWSHIGWILAEHGGGTDYSKIPDLAKFPELRWLDKNQYVPTMLYAVFMALVFGPMGLFYGYFLSTVLLWHGTFSINSVMHVFGKRVFNTTDDSRNSMIFALVTMGEGWHNNHHHYPGSAAQGFHWWQIDFSYYFLWIGEKLGVVKDLRRVPERIRSAAGEAVASTRGRVDVAVNTAGDRMHERVERLTAQWVQLRSSVHVAADHALEELESRRIAAVGRLEQLQRDYAATKSRAGEAAQKLLADLAAEIEKTRILLAETLERLIETAQRATATGALGTSPA